MILFLQYLDCDNPDHRCHMFFATNVVAILLDLSGDFNYRYNLSLHLHLQPVGIINISY